MIYLFFSYDSNCIVDHAFMDSLKTKFLKCFHASRSVLIILYFVIFNFSLFNLDSFVGGTRRSESMAMQSRGTHPDGPVFRGAKHRQQIKSC